jgi:hypothetical protein
MHITRTDWKGRGEMSGVCLLTVIWSGCPADPLGEVF